MLKDIARTVSVTPPDGQVSGIAQLSTTFAPGYVLAAARV